MTFPFKPENFNNDSNLAIFLNFLVYALLLLTIPTIIIFILSKLKPNLSKKGNFYLYAFSSAILLIIGTLGLIGEGFEKIDSFLSNSGFDNLKEMGLKIGIISGSAVLGLFIVIITRYFFVKKIGEIHGSHSFHSHSDHIVNISDIDNPKAAWLVIALLLSHRTIDGFMIGSMIYLMTESTASASLNIGMVIIFNVHIIIESLLIYYHQVQFKQKAFKAALYNFFTLLAIVPIMLIGCYTYKYIESVGWILPCSNIAGGSIVTLVTIMELVPEFMHFKGMNTKSWYKTIIIFSVGIILSLVMLGFHQH